MRHERQNGHQTLHHIIKYTKVRFSSEMSEKFY